MNEIQTEPLATITNIASRRSRSNRGGSFLEIADAAMYDLHALIDQGRVLNVLRALREMGANEAARDLARAVVNAQRSVESSVLAYTTYNTDFELGLRSPMPRPTATAVAELESYLSHQAWSPEQ